MIAFTFLPCHLYTRSKRYSCPGNCWAGRELPHQAFYCLPCSIKLNLASKQEGSHPSWWERHVGLGSSDVSATLSNTTHPGSERNVNHRSRKKRNAFKVLPRRCKMGYSSSPGRVRAKVSLERLLVQSMADGLLPTQSTLLPRIHLCDVSDCSMPQNSIIPRLFTSPVPHPHQELLSHSASLLPASPGERLLAAGHVPLLNKK